MPPAPPRLDDLGRHLKLCRQRALVASNSLFGPCVLGRGDEERRGVLPCPTLYGRRRTVVPELAVSQLVRERRDGLTARQSQIKGDAIWRSPVLPVPSWPKVEPLDLETEIRTVAEQLVKAVLHSPVICLGKSPFLR